MAYAVFANRSTRCNPEEGARKMETQQTSHDSSFQHAISAAPHEESTTPIHNNSNSAATDVSPSLTPLHLPPLERENNSGADAPPSPVGGGAVGTPSTVSTAPSTGDDESAEVGNKVGLEKMPFLWEHATSPDASTLPRPRDPGIPPMIPRVLDPPHGGTLPDVKLSPTLSPVHAERQQNNHRRVRSWGEGTTRHAVAPVYQRSTSAIPDVRPPSAEPQLRSGGGMPHFSLPGVHESQHSPFQTNYYQSSPTASPPYSLPHTPPRSHTDQHSWAAAAASGATQQPRVASFRTDPSMLEGGRHVYAPVPSPEAWSRDAPRQRQQQQQQQHVSGYHTPPYPPYKMGQGGVGGAYGHHSPPSAVSPPRGPRIPRQAGQGPHRQLPPGAPAVATPPRSSSEILKTLLRKKACLYEPDTSRAVALVTWMVGRELALEYGYFSRQQLQSGVHACVAKKIESGAITRTKVNRCMQIILNSCFHYIIPRPDGTEESGAAFREAFALVAKDDSYLVRTLEPPWDDLLVDRESILKASTEDKVSVSPDNSPTLESVRRNEPSATKRTVLLCFNENVRSVEDVFRCHTEFIRDTANASKLQLSSQEWRSFFGKDGRTGGLGVPAALTQHFDSLGQFSPAELAQFRTTWCAKRYDHDHELCGFAHVDVNGGWLRRNPVLHNYKDEMCPSISTVIDDRWGPKCFVINSCPKGEDCPFAHSKEEIDYHPNRYKSHTCSSLFNSRGAPVLGRCPLGDVCPNLHPSDASQATRFPESAPGRKPSQRGRQSRDYQARSPSASGASGGVVPEGAPMLYVNPAPKSQFESRLGMPGLQSLFRRHCHVINAHLRGGPDRCKCNYSNFGDDWGISFKAL